MRFSAIGDVAMTVPVVYALAKQYPDIRITVLSRPFARPFFEGLAPNVSFMAADVKGEYKGVKGLNALFRRLTAKNFTAVADLHSVLRTEYLRMRFKLGGFKVAHLDKNRKQKRQLIQYNNKRLEPLRQVVYAYADVFAKLGYPVTLGNFRSLYGFDRGDLSTLQGIEPKNEGELWIGVAPFAGHRGKIYPEEKMEQVVQSLLRRHPDCRIMLFGGGDRESEVISGWCKKYPQCCFVSGMLNGLGEELTLMSWLDVMLSMDSANMHLASLVAVPVVSVWGATHPFAGFMGWNQSEKNAVQLDMPCRPCSIYGGKPCHRGDYACLANIAPDDIANKVEYVLRSEMQKK